MTTQPRKFDLNNPRTANLALGLGVAMAFALTAIVWLIGGRLAAVPHLPDQGALDYYWKLANPTTLTRAVVWGSYLAHQIFPGA